MMVDGSSVLHLEIFHHDATVVPLHWLERGGWQDNLVEIGSIIYFIELEEEIGRILCKFSIRHFSNIEHWEKGGPNKIVLIHSKYTQFDMYKSVFDFICITPDPQSLRGVNWVQIRFVLIEL